MKTFLVVVSLLLFLNALQSQACSPSAPPQQDPNWFEESVNISLSFKTQAANGPVISIGISRTSHKILNLSLADGGLHLQGSVYKGTSIVPRIKDTGEMLMVDDKQWHDVYLTLKDGGQIEQ